MWSGLDAGSVVLFDSGRGGQIPFEGVISEGPAVRIQFITDQPNHNTGFNIRYEGNQKMTATFIPVSAISKVFYEGIIFLCAPCKQSERIASLFLQALPRAIWQGNTGE